MKSLGLGARLLQSISDATAYLATALLAFDQAIASLLDRQSLLSDQARITVLALIVASLVVSLKLHERNLERMTSMTADKLGGVEDLVPSSQAIDLRGLMSRAEKIRILSLAGTKLALLGDDEILKLIIHRERNVVLLLGNPRSDLIRLRYERDEPDTYETGLEGLERRLRSLLQLVRGLRLRDRRRLDIRVFSCYPTCSLVQADNDMYAVIYGCKLRGSDCPKIHTRVGSGPFPISCRHILTASTTMRFPLRSGRKNMDSSAARGTWVVFDLFGVLISSGLESALDELVSALGRPSEEVEEAYRSAEPQFDRGEIDQEEFWSLVLSALDVKMDWRALNSVVLGSYRILPDGLALLGAVTDLSNPVALMTNARWSWLEQLGQEWSLLRRFDHVFVSSEFGVRKPDPSFYEMVERRLRTDGKSLLLIDDTVENTQAAVDRGWRSIHYTSALVAEPQLRVVAPELRLPPYVAAYSGVIVPTLDGTLVLQRRDAASGTPDQDVLSVFGDDARPGETPDECARRGLIEETGYIPPKLCALCVLGVPVSVNRFKSCTYFVAEPVEISQLSIREGSGLYVMAPEQAVRSSIVTEHARVAIEAYMGIFMKRL